MDGEHATVDVESTPIVLTVYDDDWNELYSRELNARERDVYAMMIMRSLRGSFFPLDGRITLLKSVAESGLKRFDEDYIVDKAEKQFERDYADGRTWRRDYGDKSISPNELDKSVVEALSQTIPDDLTWDDYRINSAFDQ